MSKKNLLFCLIFFCFLFLLTSLFKPPVWGEETKAESVHATIKISICGNNLTEGGENCDNDNLAGKDCLSLGYGGGPLSCQIDCTFDTSACLPAPSPSPSPNSSPIVTTDLKSSPTAVSSPIPAPTSTLTPTTSPLTPFSFLTTPFQALLTSEVDLPSILFFFDADNSGRIEPAETPLAVEKWVSQWRKKQPQQTNCDLNQDKRCNLIDFSVLLYYIQ